MKIYEKLADLQPLIGMTLGTSDWLVVDQERIDQFATVTGDDQWIHTDPQRAARGIFGTTIAHGFLTLSLLGTLVPNSYTISESLMAVNYGLNRVRFPSPVPVGSRLRAHHKLLAYQPFEGGVQVVSEVSIERDGSSKPVCVAECVVRYYL